MFGFHEKRKIRSWARSKPVLVFLLIPIGFLVYAAYNAREARDLAHERRLELAATLADLETRSGSLRADIEDLGTDHGVEAALRQRYDVAKEGEEVIVLIEEEEPEKDAAPAPIEDAPSIWTRLMSLF